MKVPSDSGSPDLSLKRTEVREDMIHGQLRSRTQQPEVILLPLALEVPPLSPWGLCAVSAGEWGTPGREM